VRAVRQDLNRRQDDGCGGGDATTRSVHEVSGRLGAENGEILTPSTLPACTALRHSA
jgi:hypothetical protein